MANVRLRWALPATRQSGLPLDVSEIASVEIAISGDAGANFTVTDAFPPAVLETLFNDIEPGEWLFRGVVVDTAGRRSNPVVASIVVPDDSPPGELTLTLSLA